MAFNTGNNVPSTDPRDLYDNATNLDNLVNGADPFYADRKGVLRESWAGMENSFGNAQEGRENAFGLSQADKESRFQAFLVSSGYVSKGDYAAGIVLAERNEYVAVNAATTGTTAGLYRPNAEAVLPLTLTGVWADDAANLVLLGDDVLRQELGAPSGSEQIGFTRKLLASRISTVSAMLSTLQVSIWEYQNLITELHGSENPGEWDWTPAINAALLAAGAGGTVLIPDTLQCRVDGDLIVPAGCRLMGLSGPWKGYVGDRFDFYGHDSSLHMGPLGRILLGAGATLQDLLIIRLGLTLPVTKAAAQAWTGRAVEAQGDNWSVIGCSIFGFAHAVYSDGYQRMRVEGLQADCFNGVHIKDNYDVGVIAGCHLWPFLTSYSEAEPVNVENRQRGVGYHLEGVSDWTNLAFNFSYGYATGYRLVSVDDVAITSCAADGTSAAIMAGSVGFDVGDDCKGVLLIGCQAASQETGVSLNPGSGRTVTVTACSLWNNSLYGISIGLAEAYVGGGTAVRGGAGTVGSGLLLWNGASRITLDGVTLEDFAGSLIPLNLQASFDTANLQIGRITYINCSSPPIRGAGGLSLRSLPSAADIPLPSEGSDFLISGTESIANFTGNIWPGRIIRLSFISALTLVNSTALRLGGSVNLSVTADSSLTLQYANGRWNEVSRAVM